MKPRVFRHIGEVISWPSTQPAGRGRPRIDRPGDERRGFRDGGDDAPDRRGGGDADNIGLNSPRSEI